MRYKNKKSGSHFIDINSLKDQNQPENLTVISLFSGAGGLDIGLEQAGFSTIACIENNADCRATLRHNRPEWRLFESQYYWDNGIRYKREAGDIRQISADELLEFADAKKGEVSLVVGGAPCQPFSNIGKKQGENDERNGDLFLEFVRMVKGIQPMAFIFENVAGITQAKHSGIIDYMLGQFRNSGYRLSYGLLNAADYGVPQRRERFILVGIKSDEKPAFPMPTHSKDQKSWSAFVSDLDFIPIELPRKWATVGSAFSKLPENYKSRSDYAVMNASPIVQHRMTFIEQGKNFKVLPMELRPECWKSGKHQGNDTFGRLIADYPSVTIRTAAYNPAKGMYIHPFENRGLNTLEMAALQDFPIDWKFKCEGRPKVTLVSAGKQIGNAVPPGLGRALGFAIKKQLVATQEFSKKHLELVEAF